jgi:hypothetical protein
VSVTLTGAATPRSSRTTWIVRVNGRTVFGSFDRAEAQRVAEREERLQEDRKARPAQYR